MITFIAEKPSVAKEFVKLLTELENQSFSQKDGYFESQKYFITWCFGHLVTLAEPSDYGWSEWGMNKLPMIPTEWKYIVKNDSGVKKQFNTIKFLLGKSDTIINGADPDREGELIVRLLIHLAGSTSKPLFRFWNRSMTFKDLSEAWLNKVDAKSYNNLYSSASCRQRADWLIGMNLSRAYSMKSNVKGLSIGRVQTPTLAMIVERDLEIENWKESFFTEIQTDWKDIKFNYIGDNIEGKTVEFITDNEQLNASNLVLKLKDKAADLISLNTKDEKGNPQLFYNLADLQKDGNNVYGYSADKSLSLVQSLYEKKILSYPRTDCNFVTEDMYQECHALMLELNDNDSFLMKLNPSLPLSFNSKKVTAHTALIPVANKDNTLSQDEINIFNLVKDRFICAFGTPKITSVSVLIVKESISNSYFKTTHKHVVNLGWEVYLNKEISSTPFPNNININDVDLLKNVSLIKKERSKPKYFTEATILTAMENVSKNITEEELKDVLKKNGIGTPATRGNILEQLKKREYISVNKKQLISTEKGRSLILVVNDKIKSPTMTAQWEKQLSEIESGEINWKLFYNNIVEFTSEVVNDVKTGEDLKITTSYNKLNICPDCKKEALKINKGGAFCSKEEGGCDLKLFKKQFGKELSDKSFSDLLQKRKTSLQKLKSKVGKPYEAILIRKKEVVSLEFKK